jgi:hypothetical protein
MWCRLLCFGFLLFACPTAGARPRWHSCLPSDVKGDEITSAEQTAPGKAVRRITVERRLKQLNARCRGGKLIAAKRREIRFYRLTGCWGNPPADYQKILQRQRDEVAELKKRYTLIEITCNPGAALIP